jgi:hypothetical protein
MAEQYEEDYEDEATLLKDLRRQIRNLQKENTQLETELSGFRQETRQQSVAEVLSKYGVNNKMAKLIPSDVEGEEAITEFLREAGILDEGATPVQNTQTPKVDPSIVQETQRQQSLTTNSMNPNSLLDFERRINDATSQKEIEQILKEFGQSTL